MDLTKDEEGGKERKKITAPSYCHITPPTHTHSFTLAHSNTRSQTSANADHGQCTETERAGHISVKSEETGICHMLVTLGETLHFSGLVSFCPSVSGPCFSGGAL